jgi:hypothetical protein
VNKIDTLLCGMRSLLAVCLRLVSESGADSDVRDQSNTLCRADGIQSQPADGISNLNYRINYTDLFALQQSVA